MFKSYFVDFGTEMLCLLLNVLVSTGYEAKMHIVSCSTHETALVFAVVRICGICMIFFFGNRPALGVI